MTVEQVRVECKALFDQMPARAQREACNAETLVEWVASANCVSQKSIRAAVHSWWNDKKVETAR